MRAVLLLLALLGGWELYADVGGIDPLVLPAPHAVAQSLWSDRALLGHDLAITGGEVMLGILLALAAGVASAAAIHLWAPARRAVYPLLVGSQTIPIVVIAPLLVTWLGFGLGPKLVIVGLICFFPVAVTTLDALRAVDAELLKLMRTLDAPRGRVFRLVEAPSALPALFSGARIAVATSVIGAVLAEQGSATEGLGGLGHLITYASGQLETPQAYAAVVLLCAFALTLFGLLTLAERRAVPWADRTSERLPA